jgi:hypothetical protein
LGQLQHRIDCSRLGNKDVADELGISEQQVANFNSIFLLACGLIQKQGVPEDVFLKSIMTVDHGQGGSSPNMNWKHF